MLRIKFFVIILISLFYFAFGTFMPPANADVDHCGTISSDETWSSSGNVHTVSCSVTVAPNATLTITEGTVIKFFSGTNLIVNGTLRILGTSGNPVYLTSYRDDTVGGDTNGDGASNGRPDDWTTIYFSDTSNDVNSLIDYAVIRYGGTDFGTNYGAVTLSSASPTIQNTQITNNAYCAIRANLASFPTLINNNLEYNDANGFCLDGGTVAADSTWDVTDTSYYVRDSIAVAVNTTLTIQPDVVVKFASSESLTVNGTLRILGTSGNPVYLTSYRDDTVGGDTNGDGASNGRPDDWTTIYFSDTSNDVNSLIDYAVIRYGGTDFGTNYGAVTLSSASPTIQNTQITNNAYCAIRANLASFPTLINNNLEYNDANGFCLDGGTVAADSTWDVTDTSYYVRDSIAVAVNTTLTIQPDVVVKFASSESLTVNGTLRILGTAGNPVYLTSYRDDTVGGDTNGDGASNGRPDDWTTIYFSDTSNDANSLIDYAVIRYGGTDFGTNYGAVTLSSASPTIQNTQITNNAHAGLLAGNSLPTLICNNIMNNLPYGINNLTPNTNIDAEDQWWGSASGPYQVSANPTGTGNQVSTGVNFSPWLNAPCGTNLFTIYLPAVIR